MNAGTVNVKLEGRGNYTGTRRVSYDIARAPLTVVTGGDAKVYDGKALTNPSASLSGLIGDQTAPIEATGSITNVGITKNTYAIDWNAGTASESNYQIATEQLGMLAVSKRTVNVTADNKRKVYGEDNPALTFTVAEGGLVDGDTLASLGVTPVPTTNAAKTSPVGTYPIDFADPQTSTQNYNLEYHPGTLAVTRSKESVVIAAKSAGKVYDGTPLTEAGFEVTGKLAEGDRVTDVVMSAGSSLTNVGSQPNQVESYVIRNASGEDVTASYDDVTLQGGTLVVTKRPIVFVADSDLSRTYDGTEQSVVTWHSREGTDQGLAAGHQTNVSAEGKGMLPGVYPVTVTSAEEVSITDAEGADVTTNYQVRCVEGAMRIWPISTQIAITAASAAKTYDGSALVNAGFSATAGVLLDGDELQATVEGAVTHVGDDGTNKVTSYKVMRGDVDVTSGYTFGASVNGKLTVTPAQLTVTTDSATKTYDGTPLTAPGSLAGLVGEETATLVTTGSITDPGSTSNGYEIRWDGTAREGDYAVGDESLGTLTVTEPASDKVYACVQGDGATWTHGSGDTLTFVYKCLESDEGTFSHFAGLEVDGVLLPTMDYDAKSGSLVVTLKSGYLQGLSAGAHTLQPRFDDGSAQKAGFAVANTTTDGGTAGTSTGSATTGMSTGATRTSGTTTSVVTPNTGDESSTWFGLLCVLGLAALALARKVAR